MRFLMYVCIGAIFTLVQHNPARAADPETIGISDEEGAALDHYALVRHDAEDTLKRLSSFDCTAFGAAESECRSELEEVRARYQTVLRLLKEAEALLDSKVITLKDVRWKGAEDAHTLAENDHDAFVETYRIK